MLAILCTRLAICGMFANTGKYDATLWFVWITPESTISLNKGRLSKGSKTDMMTGTGASVQPL